MPGLFSRAVKLTGRSRHLVQGAAREGQSLKLDVSPSTGMSLNCLRVSSRPTSWGTPQQSCRSHPPPTTRVPARRARGSCLFGEIIFGELHRIVFAAHAAHIVSQASLLAEGAYPIAIRSCPSQSRALRKRDICVSCSIAFSCLSRCPPREW